ncbi:MAG: RNA methyltransferase [Ferruginibacter sp.]
MFSKSTIKYIQSLQHKKFRDEHNAFIAEGPKLVGELLASGAFACSAVYALEEWANNQTYSVKNQLKAEVEIVKDFELEKITSFSTANQVLAVFEKKTGINVSNPVNEITLVLDDIQDPGNLGTIIRIADWFGIKNMICSLHTADMYNPKVVQSTMASLGKVNIFYTDIEAWLSKNGAIKKYAAALHGATLSSVGKIKEGILIIGNESKGISPNVMALANEKITIPRIGEAESLNAAVATGIILYSLKQG